jgi:hypothetical protein
MVSNLNSAAKPAAIDDSAALAGYSNLDSLSPFLCCELDGGASWPLGRRAFSELFVRELGTQNRAAHGRGGRPYSCGCKRERKGEHCQRRVARSALCQLNEVRP